MANEPFEVKERDLRNRTSVIIVRGETVSLQLPEGSSDYDFHEQTRANEYGQQKDGLILQP